MGLTSFFRGERRADAVASRRIESLKRWTEEKSVVIKYA